EPARRQPRHGPVSDQLVLGSVDRRVLRRPAHRGRPGGRALLGRAAILLDRGAGKPAPLLLAAALCSRQLRRRTMQKRRLGKSSFEVSVVGLGCNNFGVLDVASSRKVIDRAIDLGITLFDTADVYGNRGGSEEQLGQILGPRRKNIVL